MPPETEDTKNKYIYLLVDEQGNEIITQDKALAMEKLTGAIGVTCTVYHPWRKLGVQS